MYRQQGFVSFGAMTLLVGGGALLGLFIYGSRSGHELPFWPAVAVTVVNVIAAGKVFLDMRKARLLAAESREKADSAAAGKADKAGKKGRR